MFTQCPKCQAAFRITAQVLQQARGQVLCGSCQNAFNALDHLSEEPPTADSSAPDEKSKALLDTLNRLAGPEEVRIEDTGVEWLVVDEADAAPDTSPAVDATGSMRWVLEDADGTSSDDVPKVSDEVPVEIDLDTADTTEHPTIDEQEAMAFVPDEPRYDDNTPLPDDFEEQHNYVRKPDHPLRRATDPEPVVVVDHDAQSELELSEPGDWTDLLDEVGESAPDESQATASPSGAAELPLEVEEELAAIHDELSAMPESVGADADDGEITIRDSDLDITLDEPVELEGDMTSVASGLDDLLEAMSPDATGKPASDKEEPQAAAEAADDDAEGDGISLEIEPGEAEATPTVVDPETAALDDAIDIDAAVAELEDASRVDTADADPDKAVDDIAADAELDDAIDFDAAARDDASEGDGALLLDAADADAGDAPGDVRTSDDEDAADALSEAPDGDAPAGDDAAPAETGASDTAEPEIELDGEAIVYEESTGEFERAIADAEGAILADKAEPDTNGEDADDEAIPVEPSDEASKEPDSGLTLDTDDDDETAPSKLDEDIAAMTGNMQIDENILRAMKEADLGSSMTNDDGSPIVEAIVMEGDAVSAALDDSVDTGTHETRQKLTDPGSLVDTYMLNRSDLVKRRLWSGKGAIVAVVVLVLVLLGQIVHNSREALATSALFNQTLGPIYRTFGSPVTPTWDIKGWQFETTSGSTNDENDVLTISSRLSNRSTEALPYPLVHVSLTDRYEEIIGSRVLEPNEYLAGSADPSQPVPAGERFTAIITIAQPAAEATGFKLNVCYRIGPGRVRCAIEDFKAP